MALKTHRSFDRHYRVKLAVLLTAIVGSFAFALVAVSEGSPASPTSNPLLTSWQEATSIGPIAAPATSAAEKDFDYFPDHYVNQATKIEEPIATF